MSFWCYNIRRLFSKEFWVFFVLHRVDVCVDILAESCKSSAGHRNPTFSPSIQKNGYELYARVRVLFLFFMFCIGGAVPVLRQLKRTHCFDRLFSSHFLSRNVASVPERLLRWERVPRRRRRGNEMACRSTMAGKGLLFSEFQNSPPLAGGSDVTHAAFQFCRAVDGSGGFGTKGLGVTLAGP